MKFASALLAALLLPAAAYAALEQPAAAAELTQEDILANPGWSRRALLAKKKKADQPKNNNGGGSSKKAKDQTIPLAFTILTRSGAAAQPGDPPMGGLVGSDGSPVITQVAKGGKFAATADPNNATAYYTVAGIQEVSTNPDYTSILPVGKKLFAFVHFEGPLPSQLYFMELLQDSVNGALKILRQKAVDWSDWGGLWLPCAGSVTPWGTHLGSEEYEPDAKPIQAATSLDNSSDPTSLKALSSEQYGNMVAFNRYFGLYYQDLTIQKVQQVFNPYKYGYITELKASKDFTYTNVKHYAMGRLSHEMGDVMPDERTVYMTDDGTNTGLYKFIATKPRDLSAGALYMAKVTQNTPAGEVGDPAKTTFSIKWLKLGAANQSQIEDLILDGIKFTDIFVVQKPAAAAPFCATGFTSINAGQSDANHECIRLKDDSSKTRRAAAFLETRRYGAMMGATTEFSKLEGMVLNLKRRTLAFSVSDVRYGMESNQKQGVANTKYDIGGNNDLRLSYNLCGCVWELPLTSSWDTNKIVPLVCGNPNPVVKVADNSCDVNSIASPDNLALIPEQNILIIGEDTSGHQNDMIWTYDYTKRQLRRIATSTFGAEFTSVDWYEIGDYGYLTAVVQHPYGESDELRILDAASTGFAGIVGYVGPIKLSDIKDKGLTFETLQYAKTNAEKHQIRVSPSVRTS